MTFPIMVLFFILLLKAARRMRLLNGGAAFACPGVSILSRFLGGHAPPPDGGDCAVALSAPRALT